MKKLLSILLCVMLVMTIMPAAAFAETGTDTSGTENSATINYTVTSETTSVTYSMNVTVGAAQSSPPSSDMWLATNRFTEIPNGTLYNGFHNTPITVYMNGENGEVAADIDNVTITLTNASVGTILKNSSSNTFQFTPSAEGESNLMVVIGDSTYTFKIVVESGDLGNGGNQGGAGNAAQIHLMTANNQAFHLDTIFTNELGADKKFYFALETEGNSMPQNLRYELEDKYMSMANGGYNRADGIMDTTSTNAGILVTPLAESEYSDLYKSLGLDEITSAYQLYEAVVNSDKLADQTYLKAGIVNGWIRFYDDNNNVLAEKEISIFTDSFQSKVEPESGNSILFFEEGDNQPAAISEKTLKMYKALSDTENAIYVDASGEALTVTAFLTYEEGKQNGTVTGYQSLGELDIEASQYGDNIFKITLPAFYGHNDIVMVASCGEGDYKQLKVKKAVQYKYTADGLDLAEIQSDYLNQLAVKNLLTQNSQLPNLQSKTILGEAVTVDGYTTREYSEIGTTRTSNRPYNGGFFGMTMDIADGYELEGIKVTGYNTAGESTESYLWYLMMQNCYFTAYNPNGPIDDSLYQNGTGMQTSYTGGNYGLIEAAANVAEYFYDETAGAYNVYTYADNPQAVATSMGNMKAYAYTNSIDVSFIETSTYYDIGLMNDYETIEDFYENLDKIGTIEFVLKQASAEDACFDEDADAEDAAGIKPGDSASGNAWGKGHKFEDFAWTKKNKDCYADHDEDIHNFYGQDGKKVVGAYEFKMQQNETFPGMVDIYIPVPKGVNHKYCTIYWMYDGVPVPLPCRYVDGYMVFCTSHFSEYVIAADAEGISDDYAEETTESFGGGVNTDSDNNNSGSGSSGGSYIPSGGSAGIVTPQPDSSRDEDGDAAAIKAEIDAIKATKLAARSQMSRAKGQKAVKVYWFAEDGSDIDFDGYEVFRSTKRYKGFGKKPIFETENEKYYNTAIKSGAKYYYKVRGFKYVNDEKVYTGWSKKAWRTVK